MTPLKTAATAAFLAAACVAGCGGEATPTMAVTNDCAIDNITNAQRSGNAFDASLGSKVHVQGWAADSRTGAGAERVTVVLVGQDGKLWPVGSGPANGQRPDVAKVFNKPGMATSGIFIESSLSGFPAGTYEVHLVESFKDRTYACRSDKVVKAQ
jgi:hypothetical protein